VKVLYVCDRCRELHTVEVCTLITIRKKLDGYGIKIIGIDEIPIETWQNLLKNLPIMVREDFYDQRLR
jgi:hypothetical protein